MDISTSGLYTSSKAAQIYGNASGGQQSIVTRQDSGGDTESLSKNLPTDKVTLTSPRSINGGQPQNEAEQPLYSNNENQVRSNLQETQAREVAAVNQTLEAETDTEATSSTPTPETEVPTEEVSGTSETFETGSTEEPTSRLQTVIPVPRQANGQNAPQVQLTTTGVYTNNPAAAIQANLSAPFTVDQTV